MENKFIESLKNNLGLIVGVIIGCLVIVLGLGYIFINILILLAFGALGNYVQKNKQKVKTTLKNMIDKI